MRRQLSIALVLALLLPVFSCATAAGWLDWWQSPKPVLVTAYRQVGGGDRVQVAYVDEDGGLWFLEGYDYELEWPHSAAEQLSWIAASKGFASLGTLSSDELFVLDSLIACTEDQGSDCASAANDAGTERSYAVRYSGGAAEIILLGVSGDDKFENTDATAQALYLFLRQSFPGVKSYFGNPRMAPAGFRTVPLLDFCGYHGLDLQGVRVERTDIDCEASTEPVRLSDSEAKAFCEMISQSYVSGKHSCIVSTGGSAVYTVFDANGNTITSIEFFQGDLVMPDGRYAVTQLK